MKLNWEKSLGKLLVVGLTLLFSITGLFGSEPKGDKVERDKSADGSGEPSCRC